jgi:hypothetical protein
MDVDVVTLEGLLEHLSHPPGRGAADRRVRRLRGRQIPRYASQQIASHLPRFDRTIAQ